MKDSRRIDSDLVTRVLCGPISTTEYRLMAARMTRLDWVRFRWAMRVLTRIARRLELGYPWLKP